MNTIDQSVNIFFQSIHTPVLTYSLYIFTWFFNTVPAAILITITLYFLFTWKGKRTALEFLLAVGSSFALVWVLKMFINHPRPEIGIITAYGPSFPSAHAAVATAFFVFFLRFMKSDKNHFRRITHQAFCILTPLTVGLSRVYLGVHWFSDVFAGIFVGLLGLYIAHKIVKHVV